MKINMQWQVVTAAAAGVATSALIQRRNKTQSRSVDKLIDIEFDWGCSVHRFQRTKKPFSARLNMRSLNLMSNKRAELLPRQFLEASVQDAQKKCAR